MINTLQQRVANQKYLTQYRVRPIINLDQENCIQVNGTPCIDFTSNDYLGLKKHPKIIESLIQSTKKYGFGSGASALVSGYSEAHDETEECFAKWLGVDQTILFNSGYSANLGIMSALTNRSDIIFSDKLCHASLLDGILLSRAKHLRYQHNNTEHLQYLAKKNTPNLIVTESIFSMEGDVAPVSDLVNLAKQYRSGLLIDDAHGVGVLGNTGRGSAEYFCLQQHEYTCLVLPLGKAFNAMGAVVAGQSNVIESILQFSKSYRYTTALPPAICMGLQASLQVIQAERWRQKKLKENILFFIAYASEKGLFLISNDGTPIKSILVHDNERVLALQNFLLSKGFFVAAIRPPTVPKNGARLRLSINSLHTQTQIIQVIDHIVSGLKT